MRARYEKSIFQNALLAEASHRHANEFASALAVLRLVKARSNRDDPMIDEAIERLQNSVLLERLLLNPKTNSTTPLIHELAMLICLTRTNQPPLHVRTLGVGLLPSDDNMKLFLRVAYEMILNAIKHHVEGEDPIKVLLVNNIDNVRILVSNSTVHHSPPRQVKPSGLLILRNVLGPLNGRIHWHQREDRFLTMMTIPAMKPSRRVSESSGSQPFIH